MVSIMQSWKNRTPAHSPADLSNKIIRLLILSCLLFTHPLQAQVRISEAASPLDGDYYVINAGLDIELDETALTALHAGVQLEINVAIRLERVRGWLWDPIVKEDNISMRLERHPLVGTYQITWLATGEKAQYQGLEEALAALRSIAGHPLINKDILDPESAYVIHMLATLDVETPPAPLRLMTAIAKKWDQRSDWRSWPLR
jgi:hypothetical protein